MNTRHLKILILFIVIAGLSTSLSAQEKINQTNSKGFKQGVWNKKDVSGNLIYTGSFNNGKPEGEFIYYDSTGKVRAKTIFTENGSKAYTSLYKSGIKITEGLYVNEKKDGVWKYYNSNSVVVAEESYLSGVANGIWKTYYSDGTLLDEMPYQNGTRQGSWRQYFPDGLIKTVGTYKDDKLEGLATFYHPNGRVFISGVYVNNFKDGVWVHMDDKGVIEKREVWANGFLMSEEYFNKAQERMAKEEK